MSPVLDPLLIAALALNFMALGVSRIRASIKAVAGQGMLLGMLPLFVHPHLGLHVILLAAGMIGLKGFLIPALLIHAMREADIQQESKAVVRSMYSLLLGGSGTCLALLIASTLPLADEHTNLLIVPAAFATAWSGILLMTMRRIAIMQVLGYLLLENGIFMFGLLLLEAMPFLVEIGVLLDLFTGVFVMGILIHHISREFPSISTKHLTELKE